MKKAALLLIFVLLLFACTTSNIAYNQKLEKWIGQPEQSLISAWGKPTGQKVISANTSVLTYTKINTFFVPTEYYYDQIGWGADDLVYDPFFSDYGMTPFSQIVDTEVEEICQTSFVVTNGIIQSYKFYGNNCS